MTATKSVLATVTFLLLTAILAIGAWQLGWFVEEKNVDRRVGIDNRNKGTQTAWRDEALNAVSDYETVDPSNTAVRGALRNKACNLIARLTPPYRDEILVRFETRECV